MGAWGTGIWENDDAADWAGDLLHGDQRAASEAITATLRAVIEADELVERSEGDEALAAVALLLSEQAPELLDGAPEGLRAFVHALDTELTPARRTIARGVLTRLLVPADNEWYELWSDAAEWQAKQQTVELLAGLLADS